MKMALWNSVILSDTSMQLAPDGLIPSYHVGRAPSCHVVRTVITGETGIRDYSDTLTVAVAS